MTVQVPKHIHQIWFGKAAPEALFERIRRFHPDYEYTLWTERNLPPKLYTFDAFNAARYPAEKSDILRYEVLYRYGGIYLDADNFVMRSLDSLRKQSFASWENEQFSPNLIQNGIVGFSAGHPVLHHVISKIRNGIKLRHDISCWQTTGPLCLTQSIESNGGVKVFPSNYFLPVHHKNIRQFQPSSAIATAKDLNSFTLHLWGSVIGYNGPLFQKYLGMASKDLY